MGFNSFSLPHPGTAPQAPREDREGPDPAQRRGIGAITTTGKCRAYHLSQEPLGSKPQCIYRQFGRRRSFAGRQSVRTRDCLPCSWTLTQRSQPERRLDPAGPDGFIVYGHAGDDWRACRDHVHALLGGATRLGSLADVVPGYVEVVTIAVDDDAAGQRGSVEQAQWLDLRGLEVIMPEPSAKRRAAA
jgi:hypothetical protein